VTADLAATEAEVRSACAEEDWSKATTLALEAYGDEVLGYLVAVSRNETDAGDAFSLLCEQLWRSLPRFRWECSLRAWAYGMARHALARIRRDPYRKRAVAISDAGVSQMAATLRSRTATFLRAESKDAVATLRASLDPDDQTLLILRISRELSWREIARVLAGEDAEVSDEVLTRSAATLRKRFERLKTELRAKSRPA
jgi:RNA polymerase sigma-70 factor (ECF subfamily)